MFAVGRAGRSGGAAVRFIVRLDFFGGSVDVPGFASVGAIERDGVEFVVVEGGEDDFVADDDRGRHATRDGDFPFHVFIGADFDGWLFIFGNVGAGWAAEL